MIGDELLVVTRNASAELDGPDLVVANGEPGVRAVHQQTIDAGWVNERDHGRIFNAPDPPASQIEDRHRNQFCKVQKVVRHRNVPAPDNSGASGDSLRLWSFTCALHGSTDATFTMAHRLGTPQLKSGCRRGTTAFSRATRFWNP